MRDIKDMLTEWSSYYIDRADNGYPKQSPFATERVQNNNRSTDTYYDLPTDVVRLNLEIEGLSPPHRIIIREQYTKRGSLRDHARNLVMSHQCYAQILGFVHDHLAHKMSINHSA